MNFKKIIAGVSALAIAAAILPQIRQTDVLNAAKYEIEQVSLFTPDGNIIQAAYGDTADIALSNSVVVEKFGDFSYYVQKDGTIHITDYSHEDESVVFPSEIEGKAVTMVNILDYMDKPASVTVPASVTQIRVSGVSSRSGLKSITVDENNKNYTSKDGILFNKDLTEILRYPTGKSDEEPEYILPDTVNKLGYSSFACTNMTAVNAAENNAAFSSVDGILFSKDKTELVLYPSHKSGAAYTIPETVTSINSYAFFQCSELETITFNAGLKKIESRAFEACDRITSIAIPAAVTEIGNGAFAYMSNLVNLSVDPGNNNYHDIDGVLFNKNDTTLILYPAKKAANSYTIPDSVEIIGADAFTRAEIINELIFGKSVSVIEGGAFHTCSGITSVVLPDSVKTIRNAAFWYCNNLKSITIPAGLEILCHITKDTDNYNGIMDDPTDSEHRNVFMGTSPDLVIHGTPGTVAEKYALYWGIQFNSNPVLSDDKNDTGVNVMLPEGAVPANTVLNVETKTSAEYPDATVYDISLISGGNPVKPNGKVSVRIPIPAGASGNDFRVYYKDENGKLTDMKAVVSGNYIVFTTDHFSEYILTTEQLIPDTVAGDVNNDQTVNDRDSISLDRYLGDWDIDILLTAADLNGDGKVNDQDSIILARTLAGWYE